MKRIDMLASKRPGRTIKKVITKLLKTFELPGWCEYIDRTVHNLETLMQLRFQLA